MEENTTKHWFMVVYLVAVWNQSSLGYNITDVARLKEYVRTNYDPAIRPVVNQSRPLQVTIDFALTNLIQIDMMNGQLEAIGFIYGVWKDEGISWNGTQFGDIPRLALQDGDVWSPDVTQLSAIGEEVQEQSVSVFQNGSVLWGLRRRFTTFCALNMRYYPMDEHVCTFQFVSPRYLKSEVLLEPRFEGVDLTGMRPHGELIVMDTSVRMATKQVLGLEVQSVDYSITFRRQPDFIVLHKAVPLLLLAISNLFVHVVPLNSGERISYAVTVLLAFVFWQAIVVEELPHNSSKLSVLSMIMTICIVISCSSTIISVILCRLAECSDNHPIPRSLVALAKRFRWNKNAYVLRSKTGTARQNIGDNGVDEGADGGVVTTGNDESNVTWLEAANALDILSLIIFIILLIVEVIGFTIVYLT